MRTARTALAPASLADGPHEPAPRPHRTRASAVARGTFTRPCVHTPLPRVVRWELAEKTLPQSRNNIRYDLSRGKERTEQEIVAHIDAVQKVQLSTHLNLANCYLKLDEPEKALASADKALGIDAASVKGLFRRGQARLRIPPVDIDAARADLMAAAKLDPKSREIRAEIDRLKATKAAQKAEERTVYGGIFAKEAEVQQKARPPPPPPIFGTPLRGATAFGRRDEAEAEIATGSLKPFGSRSEPAPIS